MTKSTSTPNTPKRGRAEVRTRGDVTTVRVVEYKSSSASIAADAVIDLPPPPDLDALKMVDIVAYNQRVEKAFLEMLDVLCNQMDGVDVVRLRAETAYRFNVSTETAKRYIEKYTLAFSAPYYQRAGMIYRKEVKNEEKETSE